MYINISKLGRNICQNTKRIIFEWQKYDFKNFLTSCLLNFSIYYLHIFKLIVAYGGNILNALC